MGGDEVFCRVGEGELVGVEVAEHADLEGASAWGG